MIPVSLTVLDVMSWSLAYWTSLVRLSIFFLLGTGNECVGFQLTHAPSTPAFTVTCQELFLYFRTIKVWSFAPPRRNCVRVLRKIRNADACKAFFSHRVDELHGDRAQTFDLCHALVLAIQSNSKMKKGIIEEGADSDEGADEAVDEGADKAVDEGVDDAVDKAVDGGVVEGADIHDAVHASITVTQDAHIAENTTAGIEDCVADEDLYDGAVACCG